MNGYEWWDIIFPIEHGDFPASHVSFQGCISFDSFDFLLKDVYKIPSWGYKRFKSKMRGMRRVFLAQRWFNQQKKVKFLQTLVPYPYRFLKNEGCRGSNFPKCAAFRVFFSTPRMKRYGKLERQLRENWAWFPEVGPISVGILDFVGRIFLGGEWSNKKKDNITETVN